MKKVLAVALLSAASAFATWDYFPIKPAGNGEVKAGVDYSMLDKWSGLGINAGARFSVIDGLEIAALFNFPMTESTDGHSCKDYKSDCPPTMTAPVIGLRYWLPTGIGVALDVALPFQGKAAEGGDKGASLTFTPAVQYSTNFTEELSLGSQVSFSIPLENGDKRTPSMELGVGAELDYSLGLVTPYVGIDVAMKLSDPKYDGKKIDGAKKGTGIEPGLGAIFAFNETFGADVGVTLSFGEDYYGTDKTKTTIEANFSLNF
jgi:hypothetical protein